MLVARYDLRPRKSLLGGPWNTIATRRRKEKRRRRRPSLSGSSLPRATGFAYSPLRLTRWRIYIMHPRCDGSWRKCNGNISPLARGAGTHGRSGGSCGWLVVHVCAGPLVSYIYIYTVSPCLFHRNTLTIRRDSSSEFASVESVAWAVRLSPPRPSSCQPPFPTWNRRTNRIRGLRGA